MNYLCPRCGNPVQRSFRATAGLVSALLHFALGSFQCENCGTIPLREFPADVRSRVILASAFFVVVAIAVVVISLLSFVRQHA